MNYETPQQKYWLNIPFYNEDDRKEVIAFMGELGAWACGSNSMAFIIKCMIQEVTPHWQAEGSEGNSHLDPITLAVFERDNWTCQGCGKRKHLTRHSHLKPHSTAQKEDCTTLCSEVDRSGCHNLFHDGKAEIEWLKDGKIKFIRKLSSDPYVRWAMKTDCRH